MVIEAVFPETKIETHSQWEPLITARGYKYEYFDGLNRFYLADEFEHLAGHFSLPPNVFDDFRVHNPPFDQPRTSFPLFTSIPPRSNFSALVENWESSGFKVTSINCGEEANILRAAGLDVIEVESAQKRLKISEIMHAIANTELPFAGFVNADCRFIEPIDSEKLSTLTRNSLILAERIDVDEAGAPTNVLCCGFDAFFFDTAMLQSLTDAGYRIGTPW